MDKVRVIAEAGVNHNGDLNLAKELIDAAKSAGADYVKFQTFKADEIVTADAPMADYQKKSSPTQSSQKNMLKALELSDAMHEELFQYCKKSGIAFLSTPFDLDSAHMLKDRFSVDLLKVPSGELTNGPFLLELSRLGLDMIVSTGMATLDEIETALSVIHFGRKYPNQTPTFERIQEGKRQRLWMEWPAESLTVLHCTTAYPADFREVNLRAIPLMRERLGVNIGYSDHTIDTSVSVGAVALGATVIEKHFTMDRSLPGPDHSASLDPQELTLMIRHIRQMQAALGKAEKTPSATESENAKVARRSLVAKHDIKKGEPFTAENLTIRRPGNGVSPMLYWDTLGRKASKDLRSNELITTESL